MSGQDRNALKLVRMSHGGSGLLAFAAAGFSLALFVLPADGQEFSRTGPAAGSYSAVATTPSSTTTTRIVTTRTYTRRINADGSVTEIPSPTVAPSVSVASTEVNKLASVRDDLPNGSSFDRTASAPVVAAPRRYEPSQTRYSPATISTSNAQDAPVRTVTRTYTKQSVAAPAATEANVQRSALEPSSSATEPVQFASVSRPSLKPEPKIQEAPPVIAKPVQVKAEPENPTAAARSAILKSAPKLPADEVPNVETLHQILWSTFYVMESARHSGNYDDFLKILSPRMKGEYTPTELPKAFDSMKEEQEQINKAVGAPALFELQPYLMSDGRMRLRGAFPTEVNEALRFDMLYTNVDGVWYVDAMALAKG